MTTTQREQHLKRFAGASIADVGQPDHVAGSITETPLCLGRDQTLPLLLSVDVNTVADGVRVPRNSLEGVWSKAAELLKTEGAIVSAPGVGEGAKFVLSYRGRNPHLVVPRKGGAFACDGNCPNWKALNICAHSVAAAELCSKLPEFVAWFKKANKCPNLSKFAEATMPKGRGKKGNENPRKRRTSAVTETRIENPFTAASPHESSPPLGSETPQLPAFPSTCSVPLAVSQTNSVYLPSQSNTFQWPYPQSRSEFEGVTPYPYGPLCGYGQMPSPVVPPQTFVTPQPQYAPPSPFTLCKISGNISVCAGCRNKYPKKSDPPDDLCIKHQEWREYTPPSSRVPQGRYANVYYHFNPHCVWLRCRWFAPSCLEIPPEIMAVLGPRHKAQLQSLFHIAIF